MKMLLSEVANAVCGRIIGEDTIIRSVTVNSREVAQASLFVPIIGEKYDAHDFIGDAIVNGATAFISDRITENAAAPYVLVENTRNALCDLAAYYRSRFDIPVIAITGSVGKTSVKNAVAAVLSQKLNVLKTEGNFNNDIGLPLTIFRLDESHQAAVLEMGMNHFGEISLLSGIAKPSVGIITNVGTAHIENLGSEEGILKAKLEILDGMDKNGIIVINYDNALLKTVSGIEQKIVRVSIENEADVYGNIFMSSDNSTKLEISYSDRRISVLLSEAYNQKPLIMNIMMAACVGFLCGLTDSEVESGIDAVISGGASEKGRLERIEASAGHIIINDCYNANPESMRLALDVLADCKTKKVAVLGDMLEQGDFAESLHKEVGEYAGKIGIDALIAIGKYAEYYKQAFDLVNTTEKSALHFYNKTEFFEQLDNILADINKNESEKLTYLIKASRGMKFEEIVERIAGIGE